VSKCDQVPTILNLYTTSFTICVYSWAGMDTEFWMLADCLFSQIFLGIKVVGFHHLCCNLSYCIDLIGVNFYAVVFLNSLRMKKTLCEINYVYQSFFSRLFLFSGFEFWISSKNFISSFMKTTLEVNERYAKGHKEMALIIGFKSRRKIKTFNSDVMSVMFHTQQR